MIKIGNVIKNVFYSGDSIENETIIKSIPIDWNLHANGILNIAKHLEPNFIIDNSNQLTMKLLLQYFTGNKEFCDTLEILTGIKGSLNKGLYLVGDVGTGKTLLMKIFKEYTKNVLQKNSFHLLNELDIINLIAVDGQKCLDDYGYNNGNPKTLYIDDFGSKNSNVKHYGNSIDVIDTLFTLRYIVFTKFKKITHISSNKYPNELNNIFDNRLIDRFVEMFNIIELKGESKRC